MPGPPSLQMLHAASRHYRYCAPAAALPQGRFMAATSQRLGLAALTALVVGSMAVSYTHLTLPTKA